jgi:hypothetical protein
MKREQKNGEGTKMRPSENQTHKIKEEIKLVGNGNYM